MLISMLLEDRIDWIKANLTPKLDKLKISKEDQNIIKNTISGKENPRELDPITQFFYVIDPTKKKLYTQWLITLFLQGQMKIEDGYKAEEYITKYEQLKPRLPVEQRDANKIKTLGDMYSVIEPYETGEKEVEQSNKEKKEEIKDEIRKNTEVLYKGPEGIVLIPKNQESSCFWGKGTQWCTAATKSHNYFTHYSKDGPLIIIMYNEDGKQRKAQFHFETKQFMNEQDRPMDDKTLEKFQWLFKIPKLKEAIIESGMVPLNPEANDADRVLYSLNKKSGGTVSATPDLFKKFEAILDKMHVDEKTRQTYYSGFFKNNMSRASAILKSLGDKQNPILTRALVSNDPKLIADMKEQTPDLQDIAVKKDVSTVVYMHKPTREVMAYVFDKDPDFLVDSTHLSEYPDLIINFKNNNPTKFKDFLDMVEFLDEGKPESQQMSRKIKQIISGAGTSTTTPITKKPAAKKTTKKV